MEDILEELVGEIWDEHDEVEEAFRMLEENTYAVDCAVSLDDFCDQFDVECDSESVSLDSWIMEQMGRISYLQKTPPPILYIRGGVLFM